MKVVKIVIFFGKASLFYEKDILSKQKNRSDRRTGF